MKRKSLKLLLFMTALIALILTMSFSASAKQYKSGDFKFNVGKKHAVLLEYTGNSTSVKIPSKVKDVPVTVIGKEAFWGKSKMTSVSIPSTVTKIGAAAFNECTGLKKVNLPKGLKTISDGAFWFCKNLKEVFIYGKVTSIGKNAFMGCDKATIYVVSGSFAEKHVKSLKGVKLAYRYMTNLDLENSAMTVACSGTEKIEYKFSPAKVYNSKLSYKSSNTKVATVNSKGEVTGVSCGTAVITCTAKDGSKLSEKITIKVVPENAKNAAVKKQTKTSYRITWGASKGATGYRVNKYNTKTKKWENVARTTKKYLNVKNLQPGESAKYAIRPYKKTGKTYIYSSANTYITATTLSPDKIIGLYGAAGSNSVTLSWTPVSGANGYAVYIYDKETKEYYRKDTSTLPSAVIGNLSSSTEYSFAVKAFFKTENGTVYSKYYSDIYKTKTLPGVVRDLSVLASSLSFDRVTLAWTSLEDADGYIIYIYDNGTKKFKEFKTNKGKGNTTAVITGLKNETEYRFKIRSYKGSETNLGEFSDELKIKTTEKIVNAETAFDFFIEALNKTKNSNASLTLIKQLNVTDRVGDSMIEYVDVLNSIASSYYNLYDIVGGKDAETGLGLNELVYPYGENCVLKKEQLEPSSLKYEQNGSGYTVSFALPKEDVFTKVNPLVAEVIDLEKVIEENPDFILNSLTYEGTTVDAKVQDGMLDHMIIKMPIRVNFSLGEKTYEFTETVEYKYFFVR